MDLEKFSPNGIKKNSEPKRLIMRIAMRWYIFISISGNMFVHMKEVIKWTHWNVMRKISHSNNFLQRILNEWVLPIKLN